MKQLKNYINIKKKSTIVKATDKTIGDIVLDGIAKFGPEADLNYIDVSEVTQFRTLFSNSRTSGLFMRLKKEHGWKTYMTDRISPDLSRWDVSNAVDMLGMFYYCRGFDSDLSQWDVSNVKTTRNMFHSCFKFNQDLSMWNLENVEDVTGMFNSCISLNQDFRNWKLEKVKFEYECLGEMFNYDEQMSKEKFPPKYLKFFNLYTTLDLS